MAKLGKVELKKDTSHDTEPHKSVSEEQHAALGARAKASESKPNPGDTEPEHLAVVQVPTSPEPDAALPSLSDDEGPVTGNFRELPDWQTPSFGVEKPSSFNPNFKEEANKPGPEVERVRKVGFPKNTIMVLGITLVLANVFVGGNFRNLGVKVMNKPEGQGPQKTPQGQAVFFEFLGGIGFVVLLTVLGNIFPNAQRPIVIFLLAVWMVWIIFVLPDAIKNIQTQGLPYLLGLTGSKTNSTSGTPQKSAPGHEKSRTPSGGSYEMGYRGNYSIGV